ncbi:hypothetical protein D4R52_01375 [bacterium]|nr:MAG: hypothetical protein D4R52_01375 [bacterium]
MPKTIKQSVVLKGSPHQVYEMLMDEKIHAAFTGAGAKISRKKGGKFTAWDDYIEGTNLELVPDEKIVQKWRASDWPEGEYSEATFEMEKTKGGTKLTFTQTGMPDGNYADIKKGWVEFYWEPMEKFLGK